MRIDLLGLALDDALALLAQSGVEPQVTLTSAPKRRDDPRGTLRVVCASDDGKLLTVSRFFDPIADGQKDLES